MQIPFVKIYSGRKTELTESILNEIRGQVEQSQFILGKSVEKFEEGFAQVCGARFGVGVNSGLDALILSLRVLGVGPGDEVITAPNSFVATAAAIALVGARPVFVDVDIDFNLNPNLLDNAITTRTKAIIPVHLTGNPAKMNDINSIAQAKGLYVIEDAAQAIGAEYDGKKSGNLGDIGCFSLHPLKNLHVWGDGGMVVTNSESWALKLQQHRNHGLVNRDEVEFYSYNSRLDTVQSVVGLAYLELLNETTQKRRENAKAYLDGLEGLNFLRLPAWEKETTNPVWHVFQVWVENRDRFQNYLSGKGIETKIHYPIPLHLQKASEYLGYKQGDFPVCEKLARGIISLPVRESLEKAEIQYVIDCVKSWKG